MAIPAFLKKKDIAIYILCILSFFAALFYNELSLRKAPADVVRSGGTIITNDDASYINPPRNYLESNSWGEDYGASKLGRFIRPPGYGLLYLPFLKVFGVPASITALKFFQYLLFAFSVFWFYSILLLLVKNRKATLICSFIYGCSPFAIGFLSYTLTEGITPALLLYYVYLLFKARAALTARGKNSYYFFAALVFAFLFIVRPVLGVFILLLPAFLLADSRGLPFARRVLKLTAFTVVALSFMLVWQVRNYNIAGRYVGLHPIYYADGNTIYRAPFKAYWEFAGCWAERGDVGFSYMVPMWDAAIKGDTSISYVAFALNQMPAEVVSYFGKQRLSAVFRDYQSAVLYQKPYYDKGLAMPMELSEEEQKVIAGFGKLTSEYKSEFPLQYHVIAPLRVLYLLAFNSNLSLYMFQVTFRGRLWMEALRLLSYLLHVSCFLAVFLHLFFFRRHRLISLVFGWLPFMYLFYLCYFQRGVEERYTLPVLPLLLAGLVSSLFSVMQLMSKKQWPE
ncbi:MAG: hypothetical protein JWO09_3412 [Bacteroidetes bacterium]|nr:hypothetical protein [Bacteroidota bacterium]